MPSRREALATALILLALAGTLALREPGLAAAEAADRAPSRVAADARP